MPDLKAKAKVHGPQDRSDPADVDHSKLKVAYLVSHPIQYQAPLLRRIAQEPDLSLTVLFRSNLSVNGYKDEGFGVVVEWDVPLLEGYAYRFLPALGRTDVLSKWRPFTYGIGVALAKGRYDALWLHGFGSPYHLWAMLVARLMGIPVLLRDDVHNRSRRRGLFDRLRARAGYAYLKLMVAKYLAIGTANAQRYKDMGASRRRIHLMPYAVDNAFFGVSDVSQKAESKAALLAQHGLSAQRPLFLFAAKLQKRKRCADLIQAFSAEGVWNHRSRPLLFVAGDGQEMDQCRQLAAQCPDPQAIRFLGFQNQRELRPLYRASDAFVLPADSEPWGLAINEAMSAGCAIIASEEIGAVPDLIEGHGSGFSFSAGDVCALSRAMCLCLEDAGALRAMQAASLARIGRWGFEENVTILREALGLPPSPTDRHEGIERSQVD